MEHETVFRIWESQDKSCDGYEVTLGIQGFAKQIDGFAQPKSKVELLLNKHETFAISINKLSWCALDQDISRTYRCQGHHLTPSNSYCLLHSSAS